MASDDESDGEITPPPVDVLDLRINPQDRPAIRREVVALCDQEAEKRERLGRRFGGRLDKADEELRQLRDLRIELVGTKGDNGKVGTLRKDLGTLRSGLIAVAIAALSAAAGAAGVAARALYDAGSANGAELTRIQTLEAEVDGLRRSLESLNAAVWRRVLPVPASPAFHNSPDGGVP